MPQAQAVITEVAIQHGPSATPSKLAERILDALHAAGFHITEPSDKTFGPTRGPTWDLYAAAAMGAILGNNGLRRASIATGETDGLGAAKSVATVAAGQANARMEERNK
jgi:hypothetical protein